MNHLIERIELEKQLAVTQYRETTLRAELIDARAEIRQLKNEVDSCIRGFKIYREAMEAEIKTLRIQHEKTPTLD